MGPALRHLHKERQTNLPTPSAQGRKAGTTPPEDNRRPQRAGTTQPVRRVARATGLTGTAPPTHACWGGARPPARWSDENVAGLLTATCRQQAVQHQLPTSHQPGRKEGSGKTGHAPPALRCQVQGIRDRTQTQGRAPNRHKKRKRTEREEDRNTSGAGARAAPRHPQACPL